MTEATPPSSDEPRTQDTPNWSAGESGDPDGGRSSSTPARPWDPGPAPDYETPGFQPLTPSGRSLAYPPPLGLQVVPAASTNGLSVASLVCGILGWICLPLIGALLAVIFGHVARGRVRNTGERGAGMAVAGLVLGYVNLAFWLIGALVIVVILIAIAAVRSAAG